MEAAGKQGKKRQNILQTITTYSTAMANCFSTDDGGRESFVAAIKPSTVGIASAA